MVTFNTSGINPSYSSTNANCFALQTTSGNVILYLLAISSASFLLQCALTGIPSNITQYPLSLLDKYSFGSNCDNMAIKFKLNNASNIRYSFHVTKQNNQFPLKHAVQHKIKSPLLYPWNWPTNENHFPQELTIKIY